MSWIDEEFEAERTRAVNAQQQREIELHRAKLIQAKGRELWDVLKAECRGRVEEYNAKCEDTARGVLMEDVSADRFGVRRAQPTGTTRAEAMLQLDGYRIEIRHITPEGMNYSKSESYLTFDCDGTDVFLKSAGVRVTANSAARQILKPVLFSP